MVANEKELTACASLELDLAFDVQRLHLVGLPAKHNHFRDLFHRRFGSADVASFTEKMYVLVDWGLRLRELELLVCCGCYADVLN